MRVLALGALLCASTVGAAGCTSQMMLEFSKASQEYAACIQRKPADVMGAGSSFCLCVQAYIDGLGDLAPHCATAQKTMEETQAAACRTT